MSITGSSAPSSSVQTFLGQEAREADSLLAEDEHDTVVAKDGDASIGHPFVGVDGRDGALDSADDVSVTTEEHALGRSEVIDVVELHLDAPTGVGLADELAAHVVHPTGELPLGAAAGSDDDGV